MVLERVDNMDMFLEAQSGTFEYVAWDLMRRVRKNPCTHYYILHSSTLPPSGHGSPIGPLPPSR